MANVDPFSLLTLFSITIVIGYLGSFIFSKTKMPDIFWLLLFGIIIGPVFALVDRSLFITVSPFLAALALLIILFDAGLNMDFYQMVRGFSRSMLLAVTGMIIGMVAVGIVSVYLLNFSLLEGLLLGAIVGGTCSTTVTGIVSRLQLDKKVKTMLSLESIFTDPMVIVVSIALLNIIIGGSQYSAASSIASAFSVGAMVGLLVGLIWLFALDKLKGRPFDYMLTLSVLFMIYVFVESLRGSGAIAALAFGIVLGNGRSFSRMLRFSKNFGVNRLLKSFQAEVSFFIRSFFFVYLGMIVVINPTYVLYGAVIAAVLIMARIIIVQISMTGMKLAVMEKNIMRTMAPRGLAAAVLAQLPAAYGIRNAEVYSNVVFVIILATVIYTTIAVGLLSRENGHTSISKSKIEKGK